MGFHHVPIHSFFKPLPGNYSSFHYLFTAFLFPTENHLISMDLSLHADTDLDCGNFYSKHAQEALDNKTIVESDIDQALERTFGVLVRTGWFDPPEQQPYRNLTKDDVNTTYAQKLTVESAQESIVLLKNINNALPLNVDQLQGKKIALIGPTANATVLMQGNYHGTAPYLIDPITGFKSVVEGSIQNK
jgi:beta-glucosidase-like glycosyl hydrolase